MSSFPRATENPPYLLGVNGGIFLNSTLSCSCLSHHPFHPSTKLLGFRDKPLALRGGDRLADRDGDRLASRGGDHLAFRDGDQMANRDGDRATSSS